MVGHFVNLVTEKQKHLVIKEIKNNMENIYSAIPLGILLGVVIVLLFTRNSEPIA